ncbi:pinopsin-like isoform X1 [Pundamilia nyererei]|uniref:Pinopsin-like isoform X1 n=1 Tax=Pundamilia nyererei TaxID=303518 RepID=A0A9Y3S473_9CICH|nr:PREDICTED: pinopsin-like isoform X1 [Pundamilia nyererei]
MFSELSGFNLTSNLSEPSSAPGQEGDEEWRDAPLERLSRGGHVVVSVCLGSIMVFGFLNNLLVLVLFCRFKSLRTPVNMMLLNISVSDMLVCACGTTLSFASSLQRRWLYGRRGCMWYGFVNSCFGVTWAMFREVGGDADKVQLPAADNKPLPEHGTSGDPHMSSGIVSLISLSILSYDRYSTLMVYNKRSADYRKPLLAVGGSWLYSVIWTVPPLLGWSSYGLEGAGTSCSVSWTEESPRSHSYIICLFVFCLGLPVLIMVYCYSRLLYAVKQVGRIRRTAARRREFHILFMVITTVVCYLICWMPYGIVAMMATFGRPGLISPVASVIPSILAKTSTVINPVIYILMNKQFYRCFLILFHCKHPLTEDVQSSMPSKTTMVQLNRRVLDGSPAGPSGTKPIVQDVEGISAAESDKTDPVELPLPPLPLPEISSS